MMSDVRSCHNCHTLLHSYQLSRLMLTNSKLIPDKVNREHRHHALQSVPRSQCRARAREAPTSIYDIFYYYLSQLGMDLVCQQIEIKYMY